MAISKKEYVAINLAEVLILQRFPFGKESTFFYYTKDKELTSSVGDVVKIPFRKGYKEGVVVKIKKLFVADFSEEEWKINLSFFLKDRSYFFSAIPNRFIKIKPITQIISQKFLSEGLLLRLRELSLEYFVSWNHFMEFVVEKLPTKKYSKMTPMNLLGEAMEGLSNNFSFASPDIFSASPILEKMKKGNHDFLFLSHAQLAELFSVMQKVIEEKKQILILVPEKLQIMPIYAKYVFLNRSLSTTTPIIISKFLPATIFKKNWQLTQEVLPGVFIGTRSAIFAPFKNLGLIILEEGHDASFKQWDMNPRYDLRSVLPILYPKNPKLYLSETPRFEDFFASPIFLKNKIIQELTFKKAFRKEGLIRVSGDDQAETPPALLSFDCLFQKKKKEVFVVNLKISRKVKNENLIFSQFLEEKLIKTLKKNQWVFLVANHKGRSSFVVCRDCGHTPICPDCQKPLFLDEKSKLVCQACHSVKENFAACPKCQSHNFYFPGTGIEVIKEEISKIKSKVGFELILPPEPSSSYKKFYDFWQKLVQNSGKSCVVLGYSGIIPVMRVFASEVGLAVLPSFDGLLFYPDFRSEERAAARFFNLLSAAPKVIIQTFKIENDFFKKIVKHPYSSFFPAWHEERARFDYPPFSRLIKLEITGKTQEYVSRKIKEMITFLEKKSEVIDVFQSAEEVFLEKKYYSSSVLVKIQKKGNLREILKGLPEEVKIDIDPESLV